MASPVPLCRARRDGYQTIEGWGLSTNAPMLAVARQLAQS